MKTLKFNKLFVLVLLLTTFACSNDDDASAPQVSIPTVSLANANLTTSFFTEGQTDVPTVVWNGNTGLFSLGSSIAGASVNATTGVISWNKALPLGSNTIQLVATNSAGQTSINVTIDNQFSGNFDGAYNNDITSTTADFDFEMNFNADGTMMAIDAGISQAPGTWTRSGSTITSVYSYDDGNSFFTVVTDLVYSETEANQTGFWSPGETLADPASGYMELAIE